MFACHLNSFYCQAFIHGTRSHSFSEKLEVLLFLVNLILNHFNYVSQLKVDIATDTDPCCDLTYLIYKSAQMSMTICVSFFVYLYLCKLLMSFEAQTQQAWQGSLKEPFRVCSPLKGL